MGSPRLLSFAISRSVVLAAALASLVACGGDEPEAPAVDVTGSWSGTWLSAQGASGSVSVTLAQEGASLSGMISIGGSPCLTQGSVTGNVAGRRVSFTAVGGSDRMAFVTTVASESESSFSGSYEVSSGNCLGDSGSFDLTATN